MKDRRLLLLASAALLLIGAASLPWSPRLIWNRTQSVPPGLYLVTHQAGLARGDLVAYKPGPSEKEWLERRRYMGAGWPLVKRVAALEGDEVCRQGDTVLINDVPAARALSEDSAARQMPRWAGCQLLERGEVLLLADHPRSVDGRYFGVQDRTRVIGIVRPLCRLDTAARRAPGINAAPHLSHLKHAR